MNERHGNFKCAPFSAGTEAGACSRWEMCSAVSLRCRGATCCDLGLEGCDDQSSSNSSPKHVVGEVASQILIDHRVA